MVNLPVIRWGIGYANLPANGPVSADIINADSGATLQRQTAAAITVGNGSDIRLFDNWTGRPTSVRVVNAQSDSKRRAMGRRRSVATRTAAAGWCWPGAGRAARPF